MRGSVIAKSDVWRCSLVILLFSFFVASTITSGVHAQSQAAGTTISATVCAPSSEVALATPLNDSVITQSEVELKGSVKQASQIEVFIDNVFDSIIPIDIGETTFKAAVHLTKGTHTLKLKAVSRCPGTSGETSSVITFTPPVATPSTGNETQTQVGEEGTGATTAPSSNEQLPQAPGNTPFLLIGSLFVTPIQKVADWLNIGNIDNRSEEANSMSPFRAATFGLGVWLSVFGVAGAIVHAFAASSFGVSIAASFSSAPSLPARVKLFTRLSRILGIALIVGALFL